ncbi:MAG: VCBS repeat-containing protein, partial [Planctomycetes bacterium]|nr:VCBS repeat-containing protein [Planctomycetota bacterium]
MTDINGDGNDDMLFADRGGDISYYNRDAGGALHFVGKVEANGSKINGGQGGSMTLVDWDKDGLLDLLYSACIWTPRKPIRVYLNTGSRGEPVFGDYTT